MSSPTSTPIVPTRRKCEHCGAERVVMIAMEPGADKKWWWLCRKCWAMGLRMKLTEAERAAG